MKTLFDITVSSAAGVEAITKKELYKLGVSDAPARDGRLCFKGDMKKVAECNLYLRTANRVFIKLASFIARDFDSLFDGISQITWKDYLPSDAKIMVSAKCVASKLMAASACQSISKKAICYSLSHAYGQPLKESGSRYKIEISIHKDNVTVSLDTSGEGLHKRGYRGLVGEAPLKETLASAIVMLANWSYSKPLVDTFCGTGTIVIEAAMQAKNIAPGLNRDFDFLHWSNFELPDFEQMKTEASSKIREMPELKIFGFDIDEAQLRLARKHAKLAGVEQYIHFQRADMRDFSSKSKEGVFISNPPYGERLEDRNAVKALYKAFGQKYGEYEGWDCHVITSVSDFERSFFKRADKKRKLFNGKLECFLYSFCSKPQKK